MEQRYIKQILRILAVVLVAAQINCTGNTDGKLPLENSQGPTLQGVVNGGGGKGAICKKDKQEVLEVLDIYEAHTLYDLEVSNISKSDSDLDRFVAEIYYKHFVAVENNEVSEEAITDFMKKEVSPFIESISFTESNEVLNQTNDSHEPKMKKGCRVVQIAIYYDESILIVDTALWNKMNFINKVGLVLHEIIYFKARQFGEVNSVKTRKIVGHLLSSSKPKPLNNFKVHNTSTACFLSDDNEGVFSNEPALQINNLTQDGVEGVELVLNSPLFNEFLMFQKSGFIPHLITNDLVDSGDQVNKKYQFEISEETYIRSDYIANLLVSSDENDLALDIKNLKLNEQTQFKLNCVKYNDVPKETDESSFSGTDYLAQFYAKYGGASFTEEDFGERFIFLEEGKMQIEESRQVGSEDSLEVPYPTVCRYIGDYDVKYIIKRDEVDRIDYLHYVSHEMSIVQTGIELVDDSKNSENCEAYIIQQQSEIEEGSYYTVALELLGDNSFRRHSAGGGAYVYGDSREGTGTLDEVFRKN